MFQGTNKKDVRRGSPEAIDQFSAAPPGISLTSDNSKWPWGNPPDEVDVDVIVENAARKLQDDEVFQDEMFKLLLAGVSIEHIVETWVIDGFENGRFSLDAGLLAKGPLGIFIAYMADKNDVPYRMFEKENPQDERRMDDETYFRLMKTNNPAMFSVMREQLNRKIREGNAALGSAAPSATPDKGASEDREGFM